MLAQIVRAARDAGAWWPNQTPTPDNYAKAVAALRDISNTCTTEASADDRVAQVNYIALSALRDMDEF